MNREKILSQALVAIPLFHVFTCALFLAGYSAGFGAKVGTFFGASDLFGLSVSQIFWTYVSGALFPLAALVVHFRAGARPPLQRRHEPWNLSEVWQTLRTISVFSWTVLSLFALSILAFVFEIYVARKLDQRIPYLEAMVPVGGVVTAVWGFYSQSLKIGNALRLVILVGLIFVHSAFVSGLETGQRERRFDAHIFRDIRAHCGEWYVLRSVGDNFIAAKKDNTRAVIDRSCVPFLTFPSSHPINWRSPWDLTLEWWRGEQPAPEKPMRNPPST